MRVSTSTTALFASLSCLALLSCPARSATAADVKTIMLTIDDKGCKPMELTVPPSEKIAFKIKNESKRGIEWEILKDNMVVEERENIIPGFSATITTKLDATEYQMTCGLLSNPKGKLIVKVATEVEEAKPREMTAIIADYKSYVADEVDHLVAKTKALVDAVKAGKLEDAQKAYAPAHLYYERIEPVAEVFNDLDKSMDARADDYEKKEADPNFAGFHRLEYGLFAQKSTSGMNDYADRLMKDVLELRSRVAKLDISPKVLVGGAAALIEEVASKKISGEEDRYSKTDLSDFQGNVDGAQKIVTLLRADIKARNPELIGRIEANFAKVEKGLSKYRTETGFQSYDALKQDDQTALKGPITILAEDLSKLRGTLGID